MPEALEKQQEGHLDCRQAGVEEELRNQLHFQPHERLVKEVGTGSCEAGHDLQDLVHGRCLPLPESGDDHSEAGRKYGEGIIPEDSTLGMDAGVEPDGQEEKCQGFRGPDKALMSNYLLALDAKVTHMMKFLPRRHSGTLPGG